MSLRLFAVVLSLALMLTIAMNMSVVVADKDQLQSNNKLSKKCEKANESNDPDKKEEQANDQYQRHTGVGAPCFIP
jgi:hypothetical protein